MSETIFERSSETAKKVRKELKKAFPDLPTRHFSVTSSTYAGGSSVSVRWDNYPLESAVKEITNRFTSAEFDGMQDMKIHTGYEYEGKRYSGADFILCSRSITSERFDKAKEVAMQIHGDLNENNWEDYRLIGNIERELNENMEYTGREQVVPRFEDEVSVTEELDTTEMQVESENEQNTTEEVLHLSGNLLNVAMFRKAGNVRELKEEIKDLTQEQVTAQTIDELVIMTDSEFTHFGMNFLDDVDWIGGLGGRVALVVCQTHDYGIVVDASGYSYARYTGLVERLNTREQIDNLKRVIPNVSYVGGENEENDFSEEAEEEVENMLNRNEGVGNLHISGEDELPSDEMDDIMVIFDGACGWMRDNGFVVNEEEARGKIDKEALEAIKELTDGIGYERLMIRYERYFFGLLDECKTGINILESERTYINNELKKIIGQKANEGKKVNLTELKRDVDIVAIAGMKKVKYQDGSFENEVKNYLNMLCEKHLIREEAATDAVVVGNTGEVREESNTGLDIRELIRTLESGIVTLTFEKQDGTLRTMVATRSDQYMEDASVINSEAEVNKQVESGRIPVWDMQKGEIRAFRIERLKTYTVNGQTIEVGVDVEQDESLHFDATRLTIDQMLKVLSKSVVRVVFEKSDKTIRVMYGTRDKKVIELYQPVGNPMMKKKGEDLTEFDTEQKRQAQIAGDYIRVFDVSVNDFRTFKPSKLLRMDTVNDVGSWIEFKPKQDGWYNCVHSGEPIKDYYVVGERKAKESAERENIDRINKERELQREIDEINYTRDSIEKQRQQHEERKEEVLRTASDRKERWVLANTKVRSALSTIESYTEQDEETYKKMQVYVSNLRDKFVDLQRAGKGRGEIKNVKVTKEHRVVMFGYEEDVYILHPRFILNGVSHKVFADRTGEIDFDENARRSDADTELDKELNHLAVMVTGRRVRDTLDVKLVEEDGRRLSRMKELENKHNQKLRDAGIAMIYTEGEGARPPHFKVAVSGKRFIVSPAIFYSVDRKIALYKRERHTSTLAEFREAVKSHEQLEVTEESFNTLYALLIHAFDLRKQVVDTNGMRL